MIRTQYIQCLAQNIQARTVQLQSQCRTPLRVKAHKTGILHAGASRTSPGVENIEDVWIAALRSCKTKHQHTRTISECRKWKCTTQGWTPERHLDSCCVHKLTYTSRVQNCTVKYHTSSTKTFSVKNSKRFTNLVHRAKILWAACRAAGSSSRSHISSCH